MGRTGLCWDKAATDSFFATLKNEMCLRYRHPTRAHARFAVHEYIEVFYNRTRKHSTPDYQTLAQALADHPAPYRYRDRNMIKTQSLYRLLDPAQNAALQSIQSPGTQSTVDKERLTSHIGRGVRCQIDKGTSHIRCRRHPAHRDPSRIAVNEFVVLAAPHSTWDQSVHAYAVHGPVTCKMPRQANDSSLCRAIGDRCRDRTTKII